MFVNLKKDWDKYSNKELNVLIRALDFLWRKRYKQFLVTICFVGVFLIIYSEQIIKYFFPEISNITINDKFSAIFVWITAVIVFWYSKETFDLKDITRKSLDYERAPFVVLNYEKDTGLFYFKNIGRGIAKNVYMDKIVIPEGENSFLIAPHKTFIEPKGGHTHFALKWDCSIAKGMKCEDDGNKMMEILLERQKEILITIHYENISGQRYYTKMTFKQLDDSNDVLACGLER
ncbi:MAG TPA: hypothetical protein P5096_01305 [Patescibacteria group bacterium]|nr:hypothetical protein [Patescibacteria group bacterium]